MRIFPPETATPPHLSSPLGTYTPGVCELPCMSSLPSLYLLSNCFWFTSTFFLLNYEYLQESTCPVFWTHSFLQPHRIDFPVVYSKNLMKASLFKDHTSQGISQSSKRFLILSFLGNLYSPFLRSLCIQHFINTHVTTATTTLWWHTVSAGLL